MNRLFLLLTLKMGSACFGQTEIENNVLSSAGSNFSASSISLEYTLGEVFTESFALGAQQLVTEGFHQPELKPSGSIDELDDIDYSFYPNPFHDELYVKIPKDDTVALTIYDNKGRLVRSFILSDVISTVSLFELSAGNYQLVLTDSIGDNRYFSVVKY
ncbi:MAG: T9SS type A sorting domain-containing protein [Flavobacteriia bacterium]